MTKTRKTIGVMVGGITDDFTRFLCKGLRAAAKEQDVNMVVLPGKFLDRDYAQNTDIMYEYQYDTLFSSVQKGRLDGRSSRRRLRCHGQLQKSGSNDP